ncbi:hypothetical protein [Phaeobacter inhibens]|uniref:hypothetical protein n=1 Tax=Phaeobacter inhibens TaxID=221822 RepID=UPI000C9C3EED|nr:hypothetical protein [Phaeobacter inhibens]AUQ54524.1 hypothetical protein PhaeoP92_01847 [Phaeobacter inhibens]AUQ78540.1 hypothetical protein PhaeoP74_01848 [Phaeobacter inhibens]AUR15699.1 hypothetical protein PhaeoP70_01846 [Phaeobacter inhibens]
MTQRKIEYTALDQIALDPLNPRLGRSAHRENLAPDEIYNLMRDWSLEELATSFLESGFWAHEAVLCVEEEVYGEERLVVIEGNRRIAALMRLKKAFDGDDTSKKWLEIIDGVDEPDDLFDQVPFIRLNSRNEVDAFLGFRHVTGIKEWAPPEKAQFIAKLIDENGLSYRDVMRQIGSKTPTVQRNYIAYSILMQMEETEGLDVGKVEDKFSVLFLSLARSDVREFLGVKEKFEVPPEQVKPAISKDYVQNLKEYSRWLFGDEENAAVVTDSRQVDKFAKVLASAEGLDYLRTVKRPSLEKAFVIAGGDQEELYELMTTAAYNVEEALSSIHHYAEDERLIRIVQRLSANVTQINKIFEL